MRWLFMGIQLFLRHNLVIFILKHIPGMVKNFFVSLISKVASPACTELEVVMMDWLGKLIGLPPVFLASSGGKGGGVIQV